MNTTNVGILYINMLCSNNDSHLIKPLRQCARVSCKQENDTQVSVWRCDAISGLTLSNVYFSKCETTGPWVVERSWLKMRMANETEQAFYLYRYTYMSEWKGDYDYGLYCHHHYIPKLRKEMKMFNVEKTALAQNLIWL